MSVAVRTSTSVHASNTFILLTNLIISIICVSVPFYFWRQLITYIHIYIPALNLRISLSPSEDTSEPEGHYLASSCEIQKNVRSLFYHFLEDRRLHKDTKEKNGRRVLIIFFLPRIKM